MTTHSTDHEGRRDADTEAPAAAGELPDGEGVPGDVEGDIPGGISLTVNGEERTLRAGTSVKGLLASLGLAPGLVVVERNREILDRASYGEVTLEEGDRLELVHFVGGG